MRICPECLARTEGNTCPKDGRATLDLAPATGRTDPLLGQALALKYEILARAGGGGMGTVYLARHRQLGRPIAVKVLRHDTAESEDAVRRFQVEARNASRLRDPHTVRVMDFGRDGDLLYLVMDFVAGRPLAAVIREEGRLPWRRAVRIALQVLASLREAHEKGIVHRDVKPSNLLVAPLPNGRDAVTVLDFGVSRSLESSGAGTRGPIGTPTYMAPELWRGEAVDGRADLYALGCVLYEMLTGRPPFRAETFAAMSHQHLVAEPTFPPGALAPDTPWDLAVAVLALLAKDPAGRPAGASEAIARLAAVRGDDAVGSAATDGPDQAAGDLDTLPSLDPDRLDEAGSRVLATARDREARPVEKSPEEELEDLLPPDFPRPRRARGATPLVAILLAAIVGGGVVALIRSAVSGDDGGPVPAGVAVGPGDAAAGAPEDVPTPVQGPDRTDAQLRRTVCILGPSGDLSMIGGWRRVTPLARDWLMKQGWVVNCEVPYIRGAPRFAGASSRGLVQHDGTDPEALKQLLESLRWLYPGITAVRVDRDRLFSDFDVLVPDR